MIFGIVGLGRMGSNLALHAAEKGHQVVGYDRTPGNREELESAGVRLAASPQDLVGNLPVPRVVFLYVPHGPPTEEVCRSLRRLLSPGDVVADGGNSHWEDSRTRHAYFADAGVRFLDVGTSGGVSGARAGACFMVGGDREAFDLVAPVLVDLAIDEEGVLYVGPRAPATSRSSSITPSSSGWCSL